ncbi:hypothetical protein G3A43_06295 [Paraburkholderia aspalathi]|nr:hypothetical protein [Paraburkholderia aspalathi]MBK3779858.1 hypothetical protein [Paraburkholderia aspalathi]
MKVVCPCTFNGQQEPDTGRALWRYIEDAERLSCVLDGDAVQVAAVTGQEEVPLAEVGIGLWRKRQSLGDVLAQHAVHNGDVYRSRVKLFAGKPITWLG